MPDIDPEEQAAYELMKSQQEGYATAPPMGRALGRLSQRKELTMEVNRLRHELNVKEELLKLLDENPIIERFMDLSRGVL